MLVSSVDMLAFGGVLLSPLVWCAVCGGAALLALPFFGTGPARRVRHRAAEHAVGLLVMALMWASMLGPVEASAATSADETGGHAGHAALGMETMLWVAALGSATLCAAAVRRVRRELRAGRGGILAYVTWCHPLMHLAMLGMAVAMISVAR